MSVTVTEPVNIEVLKERFPSETINPYGEVLVVPTRLFQAGWEASLKAQGFKTFATDYNRESVFLIQLNKPKPTDTAAAIANPLVRAPKRIWTDEDEAILKELYCAQGLPLEAIASKLGRSKTSIAGKVQQMRLFRLRPNSEVSVLTILPPNISISKSEPILTDSLVKEYLACVSELFPRYRNVCVLLLKQATGEVLREEQK